ncbi:MAG: hypothetical protein AAB368_10735, partial [bacterium]
LSRLRARGAGMGGLNGSLATRAAPTAVAAAGVVLGLLLPGWSRSVMTSGIYLESSYKYHDDTPESARRRMEEGELLFYEEGVTATVAVRKVGEHLALRINGKVDASTGADMGSQLLFGHLPLLLHPDPRKIMVIGLGSGVTLGAVTRHPVESVEAVEIEPAVARAARYFRDFNHDPFGDPRVRLLLTDARNYLFLTRGRYDVITAEPSNPWQTGVSNLFTREYYEAARARLADGGLMCQWIHIYGLRWPEVRMAVRTFLDVFTHTTVWARGGDLLLVGTPAPLRISMRALEARLAVPAVRDDLGRMSVRGGAQLLSHFIVDEAGAAESFTESRRHTDDRPLLEFLGPRTLYLNTDLAVEEVIRLRRDPLPLLAGPVQPSVRDAVLKALAAQRAIQKADLAVLRQDEQAAADVLEAAWKESPGDPRLSTRLEQTHHRLAREAYDRRDFSGCASHLRRVLALNPAHAEARRNLQAILDAGSAR